MTQKFTVYYYDDSQGNNPVKDFLDSLHEKQKAKIFRIFEVYEEYRLNSTMPHTKKITATPFWEIRILGKDNIRIIYLMITKENILVLHGFVKKSQKTPQKELKLHLKDIKTGKRALTPIKSGLTIQLKMISYMIS